MSRFSSLILILCAAVPLGRKHGPKDELHGITHELARQYYDEEDAASGKTYRCKRELQKLTTVAVPRGTTTCDQNYIPPKTHIHVAHYSQCCKTRTVTGDTSANMYTATWQRKLTHAGSRGAGLDLAAADGVHALPTLLLSDR